MLHEDKFTEKLKCSDQCTSVLQSISKPKRGHLKKINVGGFFCSFLLLICATGSVVFSFSFGLGIILLKDTLSVLLVAMCMTLVVVQSKQFYFLVHDIRKPQHHCIPKRVDCIFLFFWISLTCIYFAYTNVYHSRVLISTLLLMSGDVESNPGPPPTRSTSLPPSDQRLSSPQNSNPPTSPPTDTLPNSPQSSALPISPPRAPTPTDPPANQLPSSPKRSGLITSIPAERPSGSPQSSGLPASTPVNRLSGSPHRYSVYATPIEDTRDKLGRNSNNRKIEETASELVVSKHDFQFESHPTEFKKLQEASIGPGVVNEFENTYPKVNKL